MIEVKVGSIFEIVCEAKGIPHPIITWRKQGQSSSDHLDNTRRLLVEVKSRDQAGAIECVATNGVGEPAVAGIDMIVLCKLITVVSLFPYFEECIAWNVYDYCVILRM